MNESAVLELGCLVVLGAWLWKIHSELQATIRVGEWVMAEKNHWGNFTPKQIILPAAVPGFSWKGALLLPSASSGYSNHYVDAMTYAELTSEKLLASVRKLDLEFEGLRISERLPEWINDGRHSLGRALALADRAFARSIQALATYHRLGFPRE